MSQFNNVQLGLVAEQLAEIDSTNAELVRRLSGSMPPPPGFLLTAHHQKQGRGQGNSQWHSRPGDNWTGSLLVRPTHLKADEGFRLSQVCSLAVAGTVETILSTVSGGEGAVEPFDRSTSREARLTGLSRSGATLRPAEVQKKTRIKWPNDVLVDGKKIAGVLIQTGIQGRQLAWAILGIGLNVNQIKFPAGLNRPATSLAMLLGQSQAMGAIQEILLEKLQFYYQLTAGNATRLLDVQYASLLFQRNEAATYRDLETGRTFVGILRGTDQQGRLQLDGPEGRMTSYDPKTIAYL